MRVLFKGLGPNDTVNYKGVELKNGAAIEMEDKFAEPFIKLGIAYEVNDESEIKRLQNLEIKNAKARKRILEKAEESKSKEGK